MPHMEQLAPSKKNCCYYRNGSHKEFYTWYDTKHSLKLDCFFDDVGDLWVAVWLWINIVFNIIPKFKDFELFEYDDNLHLTSNLDVGVWIYMYVNLPVQEKGVNARKVKMLTYNL